MEEFIKAFKEIDNQIRKDIIKKIRNKKKLTIYELNYIETWKKIIEKRKKEEEKYER